MTTWSPQQNEALSKAGAWLRMKWAPTFYLAGYAGTGKTTLAMHLAEHANGKVAFAAFTGKAARVMRSKGCKGASTIHSLIYNTEIDEETGAINVMRKARSDLEKFEIIVIDECSMVNEEIGKDLLSFDVPVLVLGDPAQLPPISGGGYFTAGTPDYMLTDVHRQAADSPIIKLATEIRLGKHRLASASLDGLTITERKSLDPKAVTDADIIIVGKNDTRQKFNRRMREIAGKVDKLPSKGEPLICLRNDKEKRIFNGDILTVARTRSGKKSISLWMEDPEGMRPTTKVDVRKEFFDDDVEAGKIPFSQLRGTQQFTYGYAITCHKAQGSQWGNVCVFDESRTFREDRDRWLYTAVTRAAEHLTLVI
jgi:exodeoxyribonuclease-5